MISYTDYQKNFKTLIHLNLFKSFKTMFNDKPNVQNLFCLYQKHKVKKNDLLKRCGLKHADLLKKNQLFLNQIFFIFFAIVVPLNPSPRLHEQRHRVGHGHRPDHQKDQVHVVELVVENARNEQSGGKLQQQRQPSRAIHRAEHGAG